MGILVNNQMLKIQSLGDLNVKCYLNASKNKVYTEIWFTGILDPPKHSAFIKFQIFLFDNTKSVKQNGTQKFLSLDLSPLCSYKGLVITVIN